MFLKPYKQNRDDWALESQQYNLELLQHKKIGHGYHGLEKINTSLKNFPTKLYYLVL